MKELEQSWIAQLNRRARRYQDAGMDSYTAVAQAAYFGKKVALVERASRLGGTNISRGIPSKALRETALYFSGLSQRGCR